MKRFLEIDLAKGLAIISHASVFHVQRIFRLV